MKTTLQALLLMLFLALVAAPALAQEAEPDESVAVVKDVVPRNFDDVRRRLVYPEACKITGIQGQVLVDVLVDKSGKVEKHRIKTSPSVLLTREVEKLVYELRFSPIMTDGNPVRVWVPLPFNFKLSGVDDVQLVPENYDEVMAAIQYPNTSHGSMSAGTVILKVQVDTSGKVKKHKVLHSLSEDSTEAVVSKLGELRYPRLQRSVWVELAFPFMPE